VSRFAHPGPDQRRDLPAELTLRFGAERVRGRVHWPAATSSPPLIFLLAAGEHDGFSTSLCSAAAAVVLSMPAGPGATESIEVAALGWAAEHASELGAAPRLLLAGVYRGGGRAARLAVTTRDLGWRPLYRQLLVHPTFDPTCPTPPRVHGVAPATIITADEHETRYGARLRAAGIDVEELHLRDRSLPRGAELAQLVGSLGLGATDECATERRSYQP
jgi:hypothetical protein